MYICIHIFSVYNSQLFTKRNKNPYKIRKIENFDTGDLSDFLFRKHESHPLPFLQGKFRLIQIFERLRKPKNHKKKYDKKTPY